MNCIGMTWHVATYSDIETAEHVAEFLSLLVPNESGYADYLRAINE